MNILQNIFLDHYEEMIYILHPRQAAVENVEKMIHCGDPSYGGAMYGCPDCGSLKFVPFRCHSRFCPTCGVKYSIDRTTSMSFKLIDVPHRHCVFTIAEELRPFKHFNYKLLRESFQTALLNEMHSRIGDSFKKVKASVYRNQKNGFYVYAKPGLCNPSIVTKYIGRYLGRPVIATSRIDKYDGDFVTFHYNRHEDNQLIYETIPVLDFMERLIRHIPESNFKMIRYYGIYARHRSSDKKLRRVSLYELYERTMAKYRKCRPPSVPSGISACAAPSDCSKLSIKRRYAL